MNLVNHKGEELKLAKAFLETINQSNSPDVTYEAFDFHRECGVNRWDRLSLLMDKLAFDQEQFGYFLQVTESKYVLINLIFVNLYQARTRLI